MNNLVLKILFFLYFLISASFWLRFCFSLYDSEFTIPFLIKNTYIIKALTFSFGIFFLALKSEIIWAKMISILGLIIFVVLELSLYNEIIEFRDVKISFQLLLAIILSLALLITIKTKELKFIKWVILIESFLYLANVYKYSISGMISIDMINYTFVLPIICVIIYIKIKQTLTKTKPHVPT